jgi:hypothetical protein
VNELGQPHRHLYIKKSDGKKTGVVKSGRCCPDTVNCGIYGLLTSCKEDGAGGAGSPAFVPGLFPAPKVRYLPINSIII